MLKSIFEANVRDYQGRTPVNDQIQSSLRSPHSEDFWWLNNGVTILASRATVDSKTLRIENPEIVNGLQTSAEVHKYFRETNPPGETRNLLVRVVVPQEAESRDRIIKATNSQTAISPASLRATEKIHRDIEEYLRPYSLFYDRRKNHYKNEGKPISRIVSIPYMSQAVMAILLLRPDDARARPSSLLKDDKDYNLLFSSEYPIKVYLFCVSFLQLVEKYLKESEIGKTLDRKSRGDVKFHIAMHAALVNAGASKSETRELVVRLINRLQEAQTDESARPSLNTYEPLTMELQEVPTKDFDPKILEESTTRVLNIYRTMLAENPIASDKVAKSPEFRDRIRQDIIDTLKNH